VAGAIHAHSSEVTGYDGCVRGDETRVVDAFCAWLERDGWIVHREIDFIDVAAERGDERFYGETKGKTTAPGLDIDTAYGQLLRRMLPEEVGEARFGIVVPSSTRAAALLVSKRVRDALRIDVYLVDDDDNVEQVRDD
jgi:hypothetical protein